MIVAAVSGVEARNIRFDSGCGVKQIDAIISIFNC